MVRGTDTTPDIFEKVTTWIGSPGSFVLHTLVFIAAILLSAFGIAPWAIMLLVLTTIVSLEAIYLSIFIQMTVNRHSKELEEVSEDVEGIQEDIEEISEDVEGIQEDIDEIQVDVEEISEDDAEQARKDAHTATLEAMTKDIQRLLRDLEQLKRGE